VETSSGNVAWKGKKRRKPDIGNPLSRAIHPTKHQSRVEVGAVRWVEKRRPVEGAAGRGRRLGGSWYHWHTAFLVHALLATPSTRLGGFSELELIGRGDVNEFARATRGENASFQLTVLEASVGRVAPGPLRPDWLWALTGLGLLALRPVDAPKEKVFWLMLISAFCYAPSGRH
jgi:hypothetical protein